ncbi:LysE family translocator [Serinicoccus sp. LYQ131]|uniref:LysE family translocator n=1 Tax=Serinicoccus sp. LYQ131 TaxID=3378797 RepID=UPI0038528F9C
MSDLLEAIRWWPFLLVMTLAYLVPGPDLVIILRAAGRGWRHGLLAAVGAQTGLGVHMLLAATGLSVVLARSPESLTLIRLAGGFYLAYLGGRLLRSRGQTDAEGRHGGPFLAGLLTNLLNPKALLFFVSVLPQFISPDHGVAAQVLLLGVVDILFGFLPWAVVVVIGARLADALRVPHVRRLWDRATGSILLALGAWLALPALADLSSARVRGTLTSPHLG